jgi:hypothetical protein
MIISCHMVNPMSSNPMDWPCGMEWSFLTYTVVCSHLKIQPDVFDLPQCHTSKARPYSEVHWETVWDLLLRLCLACCPYPWFGQSRSSLRKSNVGKMTQWSFHQGDLPWCRWLVGIFWISCRKPFTQAPPCCMALLKMSFHIWWIPPVHASAHELCLSDYTEPFWVWQNHS